MYINEIDIQRFCARQVNVTIGNHTITNVSQWPRGNLTPVLGSGYIGMKPLKVVLSVKGAGREEICNNVSKILALLIEPVELRLDKFSHRFRVVLKKNTHAEVSIRRWHTLTLEFEGYELGYEEGVIVTGTDVTLVNDGNLATPCVIEVTPDTDLEELKLTGLSSPVTIYNLTAGKTVVIDGEDGLFLEEGTNKFPDMEIEELPYLQPGENTITASTSVTMVIKYSPRYM